MRLVHGLIFKDSKVRAKMNESRSVGRNHLSRGGNFSSANGPCMLVVKETSL